MDSLSGAGPYPDSLDSSPRSRGGDSWDEPFPPSGPRLRLMCSFGGRIVPRPTDKSLCYVNGDTRMVVLDRTSNLADLTNKLARTFNAGRNFTLKYQLPNEDLDSLISLATDEDVENMIDEYDRLASAGGKSSRLRIFLFPAKAESAPPSTIGSLLDESKSETWFVDALNSAMIDGLPRGMSADAASVNCLLGLDDYGAGARRNEVSAKAARPELVPESVQVFDTTSSFGSASSVPSLSNLPPIRVRAGDRSPVGDVRVEEQFAQMNLAAAQYQQQQPAAAQYQQPAAAPVATPTVSPTENSGRVFSDDERSEHGRRQMNSQVKAAPVESSVPDPRTFYIADPKREPAAAPDYRGTPPVPDNQPGAYVMPSVAPEQLQQPAPPIAHIHQQPQQQFLPANTHFIHHPVTGQVMPIQHSYYHHPVAAAHPIQQSQQAHHTQVPLYYLPVRQPGPYGMPDPNSMPVSAQPQPAVQMARVPAQPMPAQSQPAVLQPQLIRGMGYHMMQQPQLSQAPSNMPNYGYEYTSEPSHPQVYYSQATSPPAMPTGAVQYQAVTSGAVTADVGVQGDVKAARAL